MRKIDQHNNIALSWASPPHHKTDITPLHLQRGCRSEEFEFGILFIQSHIAELLIRFQQNAFTKKVNPDLLNFWLVVASNCLRFFWSNAIKDLERNTQKPVYPPSILLGRAWCLLKLYIHCWLTEWETYRHTRMQNHSFVTVALCTYIQVDYPVCSPSKWQSFLTCSCCSQHFSPLYLIFLTDMKYLANINPFFHLSLHKKYFGHTHKCKVSKIELIYYIPCCTIWRYIKPNCTSCIRLQPEPFQRFHTQFQSINIYTTVLRS